MTYADRPILVSLPMTDDPVNALSMAASIPTEAARVLKEWRASFTPPLSQIKAAEKLGVQLRTYTRWERGDNYPRAATLEEIAPIMGLNPEDFYAVGDETPAAVRAKINEMHDMLSELLRLAHDAQASEASQRLGAAKSQASRRRAANGRTRKS